MHKIWIDRELEDFIGGYQYNSSDIKSSFDKLIGQELRKSNIELEEDSILTKKNRKTPEVEFDELGPMDFFVNNNLEHESDIYMYRDRGKNFKLDGDLTWQDLINSINKRQEIQHRKFQAIFFSTREFESIFNMLLKSQKPKKPI